MSKKKDADFFSGRTLGQVMVEGAEEFAQDLATGVSIDAKYNVRTVKTMGLIEPFTPTMVRDIRLLMSVSQPVFARFIGASPNAVKSWEQGLVVPSAVTRRLFYFIKRNPEYFKDLFNEEAGVGVKSKRPAKKRANVKSNCDTHVGNQA